MDDAKHYLESVRDDEDLDPQFKSLLRHHWMEEAQHTKLDTLMIQALTDNRSAAEIERGISDYSSIGALIDSGIPCQKFFAEPNVRDVGGDLGIGSVQGAVATWSVIGMQYSRRILDSHGWTRLARKVQFTKTVFSAALCVLCG